MAASPGISLGTCVYAHPAPALPACPASLLLGSLHAFPFPWDTGVSPLACGLRGTGGKHFTVVSGQKTRLEKTKFPLFPGLMGWVLDTSLPHTCQPEGVESGEACCGGEGLSQSGMVGVWMIPSWANPSQLGSPTPLHRHELWEGGLGAGGDSNGAVLARRELESGVCCLLLYRSTFSY